MLETTWYYFSALTKWVMFKRSSVSSKVRTKSNAIYSYFRYIFFILHNEFSWNFRQDQLQCATWPVWAQYSKSLHSWSCDALGNAQEGSDLNTSRLISAPYSSLLSLVWRCRLHWDSLHSQVAQSCPLIQTHNLTSASCTLHPASECVCVSLSRSKTRPAC